MGAAICFIARKFLKLALLRYVDDMFAAERKECVEHAMHCYARLVRLLLGSTAIAQKKLVFGLEGLDILGVEIRISARGFKCRPSPDKVEKWLAIINRAQARQKLVPGSASKLAGKLSWGCARLFRKLGRAMRRPIFDQKTRRDGEMSAELNRAWMWWAEIFGKEFAELRTWGAAHNLPVHLFCDASGYPPHLGAVLYSDGQIWFTHMAVTDSDLSRFKRRADNQIMGLELLSISLGLSTFEDKLRDKSVVIHSDNTGSEVR